MLTSQADPKSGSVKKTTLWIDRKTFMEVKIDGTPRRMDGKMRPVAIYLREYKSVQGLMFRTSLRLPSRATGTLTRW